LQEGKSEQANRWVLYSYTIGQHGYVQMMTYIDDRDNIEKALIVWRRLEETKHA